MLRSSSGTFWRVTVPCECGTAEVRPGWPAGVVDFVLQDALNTPRTLKEKDLANATRKLPPTPLKLNPLNPYPVHPSRSLEYGHKRTLRPSGLLGSSEEGDLTLLQALCLYTLDPKKPSKAPSSFSLLPPLSSVSSRRQHGPDKGAAWSNKKVQGWVPKKGP